MNKIDVLIPAGVGKGVGDEEEDIKSNYFELQEAAGVENKALILFDNKPMLQYIVETLDRSDRVKSITIAGQTPKTFPLKIETPLHFIKGGESTFDTFQNALNYFKSWEDKPDYVLNVSSDIPLIQTVMVDKIVDAVYDNPGKTFYWNLVIAEDVLRHYPKISKLPFKMKEANFRFGDMHVFALDVLDDGRDEMLQKILGNRKKVWSVIKFISFRGIIRYLFNRLSADYIRKRVKEEFKFNAAMMITEFPEPCIDLDYAKDLDNFRRWIKDKPRNVEGEGVHIFEETVDLLNYLDSRNYKKGQVPN